MNSFKRKRQRQRKEKLKSEEEPETRREETRRDETRRGEERREEKTRRSGRRARIIHSIESNHFAQPRYQSTRDQKAGRPTQQDGSNGSSHSGVNLHPHPHPHPPRWFDSPLALFALILFNRINSPNRNRNRNTFTLSCHLHSNPNPFRSSCLLLFVATSIMFALGHQLPWLNPTEFDQPHK